MLQVLPSFGRSWSRSVNSNWQCENGLEDFLEIQKYLLNQQRIYLINSLNLHYYFNDKAPSQYSQIQQEIINEDSIYLYSNNTLIGQVGGKISREMTSIYIPTDDVSVEWNHLERMILELIDAGYPGCVDVGGPGADEEWDENKNRHYIMKHIN